MGATCSCSSADNGEILPEGLLTKRNHKCKVYSIGDTALVSILDIYRETKQNKLQTRDKGWKRRPAHGDA